jgi:hypothetical protein
MFFLHLITLFSAPWDEVLGSFERLLVSQQKVCIYAKKANRIVQF